MYYELRSKTPLCSCMHSVLKNKNNLWRPTLPLWRKRLRWIIVFQWKWLKRMAPHQSPTSSSFWILLVRVSCSLTAAHGSDYDKKKNRHRHECCLANTFFHRNNLPKRLLYSCLLSDTDIYRTHLSQTVWHVFLCFRSCTIFWNGPSGFVSIVRCFCNISWTFFPTGHVLSNTWLRFANLYKKVI